MPDLLAQAETFLHDQARLLDRYRFEALFREGPRERVLDTLRCYRNPDGGFGNALEPDLRGAASQPEPVEIAFWILDELDAFDDPMVLTACDYLASITTPDGGVPFVLPSVRSTRRAPWWETPDDPPGHLIPTASLAGLLHKHGITHPWLEGATRFCWERIGQVKETTPYEARAIVPFLELVPDRERAEAEFTRLKGAILDTVTFDPEASGDAHFPLDFAPAPSRLPLFEPETIERHLDALEGMLARDGGVVPNWPIWTPVVGHEWAGYLTVHRLKTLHAYGRLP
ncbi:hypothetical protein [Nonomuraea soli]|uniref:Prenyltransferase n=1 Tax=Nonomuraea soli TaxID=1032476 RepID=A0A7W0CLI1_9ACTN|nr:hypothetical protein [Nonomuraea soli]MBA2893389.1 hypothetical protein [Nonomuraea soli]